MNFGNDEENKSKKTGEKTSNMNCNCGSLPASTIVCSEYANPEKWII